MNDTNPSERDVRPVLACLGVSSRFRLVQALAETDRCVGELAVAVGLSQSCTTRHLQALERVGLVKGRREGRRVRFSLRAEAPGLCGLLDWALLGGGREALVAGGPLHRDRSVTRPVGMPGSAAPRRQPRGARPGGEARPADAQAPVAQTTAGTGGPGGPGRNGPDERPGTAVSRPSLRPGDLEDYLL